MTGFTSLEKAVLESVCDTDGRQLSPTERQIVRAQLATVTDVARDNTGHGFYTSFQVDRAAPRLGPHSMIDAPMVEMIGLGEGNSLGFILWAEDGYVTTLEGFQNGDLAGETVDLNLFDLAELQFGSPSWW